MTAPAGPLRPATVGRVAVRASSRAALGDRAVLVPVKSFVDAKTRLGDVLGDAERRALVQQMAERVLAAAAPLPVAVVCDDRAVATWARQLGALVIWEPGRGLNGAVESGVERLGEMGVAHVTVAHGDLPLAAGIGGLAAFDGVTLVPDRHGNGTNVIRLPVGCGFRFSYGPGSFERHQRECARLGVAVQILHAPALAHDVDLPDDLAWAP
jgi:2-phospho-L-lactate/phosphoenolpyruvate guanylyltransferase